MTYRTALACLGLNLFFAEAGYSAEQVLFDFDRDFDFTKVVAPDAKISEAKNATGSALRIVTGQGQTWPGATLAAPNKHWDLSSFGHVSFPVKNTGTNHVTVNCRVDNPGADGTKNCVTGSVTVEPGAVKMLQVSLKRTSDDKLGGKLFGMRGYPVKPGGPGTLNPSNITQLVIFVNTPTAEHTFEIDDIRAAGTYTPPTAASADAEAFFPFIDTFGQYRHKDWPGKVHSLAEMQQRRNDEAQDLRGQSSPPDWDKFGGWKNSPQLKATGFFRLEKYQGKWWLVNPGGHLFFSHGIDCVRMIDATPIEDRTSWFAEFPGDKPDYTEFIVPAAFALKGHYAGRSPKSFSFAGVNLFHKYGPDWKQRYPEVIHRRLRSWGLNTIANWSDEGVRLLRRTPYTDAISSSKAKRIEGSDGYWGKFPDPFEPAFREELQRSMADKKGKSAGDMWCVGFFVDNEIAWGDETSLAEAVLRSPPEQAAKKNFIADLQVKYGKIAKLNGAWGATYESWEALLQHREAPDKKKTLDDLRAFYAKTAEQYFRTTREVIKEGAPHQLYLGCRFAWVNARAAAAAAKYCDVVSYNLYQRSVAEFQFNGGADVPLIIGEFHFGALDRGMFHTGLVPVENQESRASAYKNYVLGALRHPQFVGCHWFQYQDQPTTGRVLDEENYQIGFVDIADTPYRETIEATRAVAKEMYRVRAGQ